MSGFIGATPNTAYMGIPIVLGLFGGKAILPVALSTIILVFITAISIFFLELSQKSYNKNNSPLHAAFSVLFKNPLVISPILGIIFAAFRFKVPTCLESFCHQIGMTAGTCALFAIGQTLVNNRIFSEKIEFGTVALLKLIIHPILILLLIPIFNLSWIWAATAFILSSLPTAAVIVIVAQKYQTYVTRASALIFETTLCSIITLIISISIALHYWPSAFIK